MPAVTIGEVIAGSSLGAAFLGLGSWIRSISNKCSEAEIRLTDKCNEVEARLTGKCSEVDLQLDERIEEFAAKHSAVELRTNTQIRELELTVIEKSGILDVHSISLLAGERKMDEMKTQLESMIITIGGMHLLMKDVSNKIDLLGEKFASGTKEVFMKLDPRIKRVEEKMGDLEDDNNKK